MLPLLAVPVSSWALLSYVNWGMSTFSRSDKLLNVGHIETQRPTFRQADTTQLPGSYQTALEINATCPKSKAKVRIAYSLTDDAFWSAIDKNAEVEVAHINCSENKGDYRWPLRDDDKARLRSQRAEGHI